jgi:hypothetical protein
MIDGFITLGGALTLNLVKNAEFKTNQDVMELDIKISTLCNSIKEQIRHSLDELYLLDRKETKIIRKINKKLSALVAQLDAFSPTTPEALASKNHLLKESNQLIKFIKKALNTALEVSPLQRAETPEYYLSLSNFFAAKSWRTSLFKERMDEITWENCCQTPSNHPEWTIFNQEMKKYVAKESTIENLWSLLIHGIDLQVQMNKAGKKKDENHYYSTFTQLLAEGGLLQRMPNEELALWSGGFELSIYAQSHHYTTLEKTRAGKILDILLLYPTWEPLGPLWNTLSKIFVENAQNTTTHVFFRVHDPKSVLERQELKQIRQLACSPELRTIVFHPIINRGQAVHALDFETLPVRENEHPSIVLKNHFVQTIQTALSGNAEAQASYQANRRAIDKMKLD